MRSYRTRALVLGMVAAGVAATAAMAPANPQAAREFPDFLHPCVEPGMPGDGLCGTYEVWEDRDAEAGRRIGLNVVVLPARDPRPELGAWTYLMGGPGGAATPVANGLANSWQREHLDILLVDQRGTGASNPLMCDLSRPDDTAQAYLDGPFERTEEIAACAEKLSAVADLRLYTTPIAADDLDEIRAALGYDYLNVNGGSYGSRAALVYMRRHPETVRTAIISGIAPIKFTNPLYHSSEAQKALEGTLAECAATPECAAAFPDLRRKFNELIVRLDREPARVEVQDPDTGIPTTVELDRAGFAEALRVFMYYMPRARRVPLLIHRAWEGDFAPFVNAGIASNRGIRGLLALGMLMSVVCAEDIPRIDPGMIDAVTSDTFLGDTRVRTQMAACEQWPRAEVPDKYGEPVDVDVPTLILSGTLDPVTGPDWGDEVAANLPNSVHLVVPGAHGVQGPCVQSITQAFVSAGSVEDLDLSCAADVRLPPFALR